MARAVGLPTLQRRRRLQRKNARGEVSRRLAIALSVVRFDQQDLCAEPDGRAARERRMSGLGYYLRQRDDYECACTRCKARHFARSMRLVRTEAGIERFCRRCVGSPKREAVRP